MMNWRKGTKSCSNQRKIIDQINGQLNLQETDIDELKGKIDLRRTLTYQLIETSISFLKTLTFQLLLWLNVIDTEVIKVNKTENKSIRRECRQKNFEIYGLKEEVKTFMVKSKENEQVAMHSVDLNMLNAEVKDTLEVLQYDFSEFNRKQNPLVCLFEAKTIKNTDIKIISPWHLNKSIGMDW
jgi:hypothetical protein